MKTPNVVVRELPIPTSLDRDRDDDRDEGRAAAARDLERVNEIASAVSVAEFGTDDLCYTAAEYLATFAMSEFEPRRVFVAERAGEIVARGVLEWSIADDDEAAWVGIDVHPDHRGTGAGAALAARLRDEVAALPRSIVQSYTTHSAVRVAASDHPVPAATGAGVVPGDDHRVRSFLDDGWTLEQIERMSVLHLPVSADVARLARATAAAAPGASDYRIIGWAGPTPDDYVDDLIRLHTRMSTDAPTGGLSVPEEPWTVDRLRAYDDGADEEGRIAITSAAQHLESGRLVAFTDLRVPRAPGRPAFQWETLVLKEHRGHRLGMLVKLENLARLATEMPDCPRIYTWNAEENRPMLSVNEELGFEPAGYEGLWKKVLV